MAQSLIHPTAIVEDGADLAPDVRVGAYAFLGGQVKVGAGCRIHHHATIDGKTTLGKENEIFPYAFLGGRTQDKKWSGDEAPLCIGNQNLFREFSTVHTATFAGKCTQIGSRNLFCAYSHIGHECLVGNDCVFSNNATLGGHVHIANHVVIGGLTAVHQFCRIGIGAMAGGCCKVLQDVMPRALVEGYPATHRTINKVGMERCGFSAGEIQLAVRIHKLVFRTGLNRSQALQALQAGQLGQSPLVDEAIAFLESSERGLA